MNFADLLESFGLVQHVTEPTHEDGHTLDLIITRCSDGILSAPPIVGRFISDHASVCCKLLPEKPPFKKKELSYRKYKSIDLERFKSDLEASSLCLDHRTVETSAEVVDKLATDYNSTLSMLIDAWRR